MSGGSSFHRYGGGSGDGLLSPGGHPRIVTTGGGGLHGVSQKSGGNGINSSSGYISNLRSIDRPGSSSQQYMSSNSSVTSDSRSVTSGSTAYRHHYHAPGVSQKILLSDATHRPRTHGSVGILVVGIGGANGTTMLAGVLANRHGLTWHGPRGEPMSANYYGCITQLQQRGAYGGVGFKDKVKGLAEASMAAVGGWDIRPTKLGDALLSSQILDYDLVKQVKDEMNKTKVFRGYYDHRFIGESQHSTATHILTDKEAPDASEALKSIRADIRYFKWRNGVVGHTTVIWSASVEPNSDLCAEGGGLDTARELLDAIERSEDERGGPLPPSLIYATAAILEGCSFVNGGSQNTMCGGLADLARQHLGVYCLGTDFKAGQTKFKTAAVEYLRTMGLTPKVIASSNHLGNNDMRNLATAESASEAKLRVKHDIFAPWDEDIDHKVSIMYTPYINDEKRDFVEYTSLGFLGQTHTMVTYTRASDSVLCVPLMIDVAVWCDFFSHRSWPYEAVGKALSYLFKVPEGAAKGVDPGFFRQMDELTTQAVAACNAKAAKKKEGQMKRRVRIRPEEKTTEWAIPNDAGIVCAGLACVDMQLNQATGGDGGESIETFQGERSIGGGSVSMACKTLARLCHGAPLDEDYMQITPPVVNSVIPLCKVGNDDTGNKLISLLEETGGACRNVVTKYIKSSRKKDENARTALAVLPIYQDGRRGCFFDAASNATFTANELVDMIHELTAGAPAPSLDTSNLSTEDLESYRERVDQSIQPQVAFLFGYPHLLPCMQGEALAHIFSKARAGMEDGGIIAMDLNGVPRGSFTDSDKIRTFADLKADAVIGPALYHVDILHMNEDELVNLTGCALKGTDESQLEDEFAIASAVNLFLLCGVAVVAVTRGKRGCFISCNDEDRFGRSKMLPASWVDCTTKLGCMELPPDTVINTNGAGDSFTAGLLVAAVLRHTGMTVPVRNALTELHQPTNITGGGVDEPIDESDTSLHLEDIESTVGKAPPISPGKKKLTPYTLYMRENYVSLKAQCKDDKKAVFTKCHEMWENESEEVKEMYERKANEEVEHMEEEEQNNMSLRLEDEISAMDTPKAQHIQQQQHHQPLTPIEDENRNRYLANRALNLESAAQFASLVAAHHIDVATRDMEHLDMSTLLERAMIFPHGLEEI